MTVFKPLYCYVTCQIGIFIDEVLAFLNMAWLLAQDLKRTISYLSPKELELVQNALKVGLLLHK